MDSHTQVLITYAIVGVAALYALWRFVPGLKPRLAALMVKPLHRLGWISDDRAGLLTAKLSTPSGCGSCSSCGACGPLKGSANNTPNTPSK